MKIVSKSILIIVVITLLCNSAFSQPKDRFMIKIDPFNLAVVNIDISSELIINKKSSYELEGRIYNKVYLSFYSW